MVEGLLFSEGGPAAGVGPGDLRAAVEVAGYGTGGPGMRGPVPGPNNARLVANQQKLNEYNNEGFPFRRPCV